MALLLFVHCYNQCMKFGKTRQQFREAIRYLPKEDQLEMKRFFIAGEIFCGLKEEEQEILYKSGMAPIWYRPL